MYGLLSQPIRSRWLGAFLPTTAGFRGAGSVVSQSALLLGPSPATVSSRYLAPERILTRIDLVLWRMCHRYRLAWCQGLSREQSSYGNWGYTVGAAVAGQTSEMIIEGRWYIGDNTIRSPQCLATTEQAWKGYLNAEECA
jgi:hypothetical protein